MILLNTTFYVSQKNPTWATVHRASYRMSHSLTSSEGLGRGFCGGLQGLRGMLGVKAAAHVGTWPSRVGRPVAVGWWGQLTDG